MNPPVGVQRKRTKGWKKPENTVFVNRPLKYGNPFRLGDEVEGVIITRENFKPYYRKWLLATYPVDEIQRDLRGKNIGCFCGEGLACHRDVLLEVANAPMLSRPNEFRQRISHALPNAD